MAIRTKQYKGPVGELLKSFDHGFSPDLVFVFGARESLEQLSGSPEIQRLLSTALVVGCTSAGEIYGEEVLNEELVVAALRLEHTKVRAAALDIGDIAESHSVGHRLGEMLLAPDLQHVLVFCDGLFVNGSGLVEGLRSILPKAVAVTGGLAADGDRFKYTAVYLNGDLRGKRVVAVGMYGTKLKVGYGSLGGWDPFGPERVITKSIGNKLYELDGRSALGLYKEYLGDYATQLPGAALRFPLTIKVDSVEPLVRTVLDVNEAEQSISFAGDIPQGRVARFMKANLERLVDGAAQAAGVASLELQSGVEFALLISCVGRRLVLKQRVEEELEAVSEQLGTTSLAGFYSYGEIAPFMKNAKCELHNQTMTITAFKED